MQKKPKIKIEVETQFPSENPAAYIVTLKGRLVKDKEHWSPFFII